MILTIEHVQAIGEGAVASVHDALSALQANPSAEQVAALEALQTAMIAHDQKAIARRMGFIGRLLGRDITFSAHAAALREQMIPLVHQAHRAVQSGLAFAKALEDALPRLIAANDQLGAAVQQLDGLSQQPGIAPPLAAAIDARKAHLVKIAMIGQLGRQQMESTRQGQQVAAGLINDLATHCKLVIDQQAGVRNAAALEKTLANARTMAQAAIAAIDPPGHAAKPAP